MIGRRFRQYGCFAFFWLLVCCNRSTAQYNTDAIFTQTYKATDGLPDSYILTVYQDSRHYLWIGTYSGLSRFDGKVFTNYGLHNGLPDLFVNGILEDKQNRIWIITRKNIGYLENSRYIATGFNDKEGLDYVYNIRYLEDKLCAFTSYGVYEFNGKTWIKIVPVKGLANEGCRNAVEKNGATYYCYAEKLVKVLQDGSSHIIDQSPPTNGPFYIHLEQFNNRLFVSTIHGLNEIIDDKLYPLYEKELAGNYIYCYFMDSRNRMWISTDGKGLLVSGPGNDKKLDFLVPSGYKLVSDFYEDNDKNLWIAHFEGLVKAKNSFYNVLSPLNNYGAIEYHNIITDSKGDIYVYGHRGGLYYSDGNSMDKRSFARHFNLFEEQITSERADVLCTDNQNNFWVVTRKRELKKITPSGMQESIHAEGPDEQANMYYYVANDKLRDRVYICGPKLYIAEKDSVKEFRSKQKNETIADAAKVLPLANGNMLVSSRGSGLWLIKPDDELHKVNITADLSITYRMVITEDKTGRLWVASPGTGLQRFHWDRDSLVKDAELSIMDGLPNDVTEAITVDGKNRVWAATLSSLVVIDTLPDKMGRNFSIYNIGKDQGLESTMSNSLSKLMTDKTGDVWFCSYNRVVRFRVMELDTHSDPPVTHIEQVTLNMKETDWHKWSKSLSGYFMLPANLRLPYKENTLTFTFNAVNFESNEDTWYSYKLVGIDTAWSSPVKSNMISLVKLAPGPFTFMVRGRKSNSDWSEPSSFSFTILAPYWKTWWFRLLGIAAASLILVAIFRAQYRRINKRHALQNQLRQLEMKALKAQMNPHFVYNALNSIQSLVIDNKQEALDYMVKFSRLLRQVLNHSEKNVVTLEMELATLKLYIELESLRLQYQLHYTITVDENIVPESESIPPLILQPFVENALWHGLSEKEGQKDLTINIHGNDEWLFCEITDNGIGRERSAQKTRSATYHEGPRGMEITINRLILYNGEDVPDSIQVKDDHHTDGSAAGTTVIIKIRRK